MGRNDFGIYTEDDFEITIIRLLNPKRHRKKSKMRAYYAYLRWWHEQNDIYTIWAGLDGMMGLSKAKSSA
jgi:hypothetical protein